MVMVMLLLMLMRIEGSWVTNKLFVKGFAFSLIWLK